MGGSKPKPVQTPFAQTSMNTFGTAGIANTPEAKAFLDVPIDIDPGVGRRGDLQEQEMQNRWNSGFAAGIPQVIRMQNQEAESRKIRAQQAADAQQAEYQKKLMELERRRQLLPQVVQTGGSSSGFNTQLTQPQGSSFLAGLGQGIGGAI